jgi:hypothetical protein
MKYFYLYIIFLLFFIFAISYYNTYIYSITTKEGFDSSKGSIILLGDSILKNNNYVGNGNSVHDLLVERTNGKTFCYAKDDSKIIDIYGQLDEIPIELNHPNSTIFLSAGGNDILSHYVENGGDIKDTSHLKDIFTGYQTLLKSIQTKMDKTKLIPLDIYYPDNIKYIQYHPVIHEWNRLLYEYTGNMSNNINSTFKVSNILTQNDDFTSSIEPSDNGGKKMVDHMLSY